jgi:DNA-binding NtrC family response regulator
VILAHDESEFTLLEEEALAEHALPRATIETALREKRGLLSTNSLQEEDDQKMAFTLVTPVMVGGKAIGAVALQKVTPHGAFDEDDLRLLVLFGQSLGPVLWAVEDMEQLRRDNEQLRARAGESLALVGSSNAMRDVQRRMRQAAKSELSVLIAGETGTGKELLARLIHQQSTRARGPFVVVNCAAIPHELFESFMFGHERGAFTGAEQAAPGLLAEAHGGTLFLDEVGDLSLRNQARILRSIEYGTYRRPGADRDSHVDVRVVSATNRDLRERVRQGTFREDLFHRLNGFQIALPPLRDRAEDIPELARHFFQMAKQQAKRPVTGLSDEALELLCAQKWAGNVRELRNCILRAVSVAQNETIQRDDVADFFAESQARDDAAGRSLAEVERACIARTISACSGNISKAARVLGISRSTLYEKMRQYDIG